MINLADFMCTEQQQPATSTLSLKLHEDRRRLATYLDQEERFMPNNYQTTKLVRNYEEERARILEVVYETICPEPRKSDAFHLAVNLVDRYLGYNPPSTDGEFRAVACACSMISMKLRRARKECLNYDMLRPHFWDISEVDVRTTEKKIAQTLKWDLNAVTTADFIEELTERLASILPQNELDKISCHSHTIANVCLLYRSFISVPPSLLASACLCDAISHSARDKYEECVASLTQLAGVDQEILIQHQKNVSEVFTKKLEQSSQEYNEEEQYTPNDIESINELEFGQDRFVYDRPTAKD